jgi:recombination DNA repair RAD52 pathway protein
MVTGSGTYTRSSDWGKACVERRESSAYEKKKKEAQGQGYNGRAMADKNTTFTYPLAF